MKYMEKLTNLRRIMYQKQFTHEMLNEKTKLLFHTPIGMDRISKMANGKLKNVTVHTLVKIAYCLDVRVEELIDFQYFEDTEFKKTDQ